MVSNARKFSHEGSHITLEGAVESRDEVGWICLAVEDDGPGIPT